MKNKAIYIKLTAEQHDLFKKKAHEAQMTLTDFIVKACLENSVFVPTNDHIIALSETNNQLQAIGKNFNQLIKICNTTPNILITTEMNEAIIEHLKAVQLIQEKSQRDIRKILNLLLKYDS